MHFTVLSALSLPQDTSAVSLSIPIDDVANFAARRFMLKSLSHNEPSAAPEVDATMIGIMRWECLVEHMVANLLVSQRENNTDIAHMEFDDHTEEGHAAYEQNGIDCVRTPDGRIISDHHDQFIQRYELYDGKVYRRQFGPLHHRKLTKKSKQYLALPNYPFRKLFPTAEAFMTEYLGYTSGAEPGQYGYYYSPNTQWDWWQIGGRWPFRFLVKNDCALAVIGELSALFEEPPKQDAPEGYRWVAGARKCDIAWDVMREFVRNKCAEQFRQYEEWYKTGDIPKNLVRKVTLTKDGVVSCGEYLYRKDENLEQYLSKLGLSDQNKYPIRTYACLDADGWNEHKWRESAPSEDERQIWNTAVYDFIEKQSDDTLLVSVDCHC